MSDTKRLHLRRTSGSPGTETSEPAASTPLGCDLPFISATSSVAGADLTSPRWRATALRSRRFDPHLPPPFGELGETSHRRKGLDSRNPPVAPARLSSAPPVAIWSGYRLRTLGSLGDAGAGSARGEPAPGQA
eukprot:scaffold721_cov235-Pinguiococcus_pyrenoidosus.AAC.3